MAYDDLRKKLNSDLPSQAPSSDDLAQGSTEQDDPSMTGNFSQAQLQPSPQFDDVLDKSRQYAVNPQSYANMGSMGIVGKEAQLGAPGFQVNNQAIQNTMHNPDLLKNFAPPPQPMGGQISQQMSADDLRKFLTQYGGR